MSARFPQRVAQLEIRFWLLDVLKSRSQFVLLMRLPCFTLLSSVSSVWIDLLFSSNDNQNL